MATGWVCPECGLDYGTIAPADASVAARSYPRRYRALLTGFEPDEDADALIRRRPEPATWSAVEYTAHVADVLDDLAGVVVRITVEDHPRIDDSWDPDERAAARGYGNQPLDNVLADLDAAAARIAGVIEQVDAGDWRRAATFSFGERDALTMARNAVHEGYHHLRDVERVLAAVRRR